MKPRTLGCIAALLLVVGCATEAPPVKYTSQMPPITNWVCYYGEDRGVFNVPGLDLMVLDGDTMGMLSNAEKEKHICLAYISAGEAEDFRWYWPEVKGKKWVLDGNPNWSGDHYVDTRSQEWRDLIVKRIAPRLARKGYDGFMLDTLDTVDVLLQEDPLTYEGAARGMVDLVRELRAAFPQAVIVVNGGLSIARGVAPYVDAVMYEGVRSTYDFGSKTYRVRTEDETNWIKERLTRVTNAGLPVLALEYVDPKDEKQAAAVSEHVRKLGHIPAVSEITLQTYPGQKSTNGK